MFYIDYLFTEASSNPSDCDAECQLELVLWCPGSGLHQVHGEDVLLEVEGAAAVEVEAAEHPVTEGLGRELGELSAHTVNHYIPTGLVSPMFCLCYQAFINVMCITVSKSSPLDNR